MTVVSNGGELEWTIMSLAAFNTFVISLVPSSCTCDVLCSFSPLRSMITPFLGVVVT